MNYIAFKDRLQPASVTEAEEPREGALDFLEYWRAIAKRSYSILGLVVCAVILSILVVNAIRPMYRGTATLLFEQGKNKTVSIEAVYTQGFGPDQYLQTQAEILRSVELARKVVLKLDLTKHPDFDPRQHYRLTVSEGELSRVERAARGAASVDDVELDL